MFENEKDFLINKLNQRLHIEITHQTVDRINKERILFDTLLP